MHKNNANFLPCCWHLKSFRLFHSALKQPLLDSLNSITERITLHVWCLRWLVTSLPQSDARRHVHLLNQQKSEKWSSVGSVQIHADFRARVHIFCTQIDVILKADCWFVLLSTWSVLSIKLQNDMSAGLWMVKERSCWWCFRCYLGHLMVTFDTY